LKGGTVSGGFVPRRKKAAAEGFVCRKNSFKFLDLQPKRFMIYFWQNSEAIIAQRFYPGRVRERFGVRRMYGPFEALDSDFRRNRKKTNFQARRRAA